MGDSFSDANELEGAFEFFRESLIGSSNRFSAIRTVVDHNRDRCESRGDHEEERYQPCNGSSQMTYIGFNDLIFEAGAFR